MPRIPTFKSEKLPPGTSGLVPINPNMAGMTGSAMAGLGQEVSGLGKTYDKIYSDISEREALAHDTIESMKIEKALNDKKLEVLGKYQTRTDYVNFDKDLDTELANIQQTIAPKAGSQRLSLAFQRGYNSLAIDLKTTIQKKKFDVMGKEGLIALDQLEDVQMQKWIEAGTPEQREAIAKEYDMQGNTVVTNFAVDPMEAYKRVSSFRDRAQKRAEVEAEVAADKLIEQDPITAQSSLRDETFLPDMSIKVRQSKVEKAISTAKVKEHEDEIKKAKIEKEAHDNEERQIADFFNSNDLAKAESLVQSSSLLSGDEKRVWGSVIRQMPIMEKRAAEAEKRAAKAENREALAEERRKLADEKRQLASDTLMRIYNPDEDSKPITEREIISSLAPVDPALAQRMVDEYRQVKGKKDPYFSNALGNIKQYGGKGLFSVGTSTKAKKDNIDRMNKAIGELYTLKESGLQGKDIELKAQEIIDRNRKTTLGEDISNIVSGFWHGSSQPQAPAGKTEVGRFKHKKNGRTVIKYSDGTKEYAD